MNKKKIAIKVENEAEFKALAKYYDSLGWTWCNGEKLSSTDFGTIDMGDRLIQYKDECMHNLNDKSYTVYSFQTLSDLTGIPIEKEPVVVEIEDSTALIDRTRVVFSNPPYRLSASELTELYTALKSFE